MRKKRFITSPRSNREKEDYTITVVLLCGNAGHRMKSYGPTPLAKLGQLRLIDLQVASIARVFKDFEVVVCGGFGSDKIVKHLRDNYRGISIRFVENQLYEHSNCCESLRLSLNNIVNDKILVCNGEIILNDNILGLVDETRSFVVYEKFDNPNFDVGVIVDTNGRTENFCYGIGNKWAEMLFLNNRDVIEAVRKIISTPDYKNKFIFEALNDLSKTRFRLDSIENPNRPITKISNIKTYHEVSKIYARTNTKLFKS